MSVVSRLSSMRIIALPLARKPLNSSKLLPVFYNFKITAPPPLKKPLRTPGLFTRWLPDEGLGKWASHKATTTWAGFGTAAEGTIKKRAFVLGERLMDQLDFEESYLKTIDLSIAPALTEKGEIPLFYPSSVLSGPQSLDNLRALVEERIPLHNRGLALYIFFAILSAPLKLIPIIPNFPFYFCAWRSWSHWKAKRAAQYIQSLIKSNRIVPKQLEDLNSVYALHAKLEKSASNLLPRESLDKAIRILTMSLEESKDLLRAYDQVAVRASKTTKSP
ncbi:mitochondrial K+-H+ exchange-related-domain-containing protein [Favolaschia claudopus]|uniref:Mitochondrial K+-H+ exchange-related-domain-containing protein n=1 Tax=Favolaschia claudopus TaxID=2862362 RepID=A0AAW0EF27_9AGAR